MKKSALRKRLIAIGLVLAFALSLFVVGCDNSADDDKKPTDQQQTETDNTVKPDDGSDKTENTDGTELSVYEDTYVNSDGTPYTDAQKTCTHQWSAANCQQPQTCKICGATKGKLGGHLYTDATCTAKQKCLLCGKQGNDYVHEWIAATCTTPKTCAACGAVEGTALGHQWKAATCTSSKICTLCGEAEGSAVGHKWTAATCTKSQTCSECGETQGHALGHTWTAATCTTPKKCSVCGATAGSALGHTTDNGTCTRCNQVVGANELSIGDIVIMGHYEQDNNTANAAENINWIIVAFDGNKALVVSEDVLDAQIYNAQNTETVFANTSLKSWLDSSFYERAFNDNEKKLIDSSKMILLSASEISAMPSSAIAAKASAYAKAKGAAVTNGYTDWWISSSAPKTVSASGSITAKTATATAGVRPAMWITLTCAHHTWKDDGTCEGAIKCKDCGLVVYKCDETHLNITVAETVDSSSSQQRWLTYPNSRLIINPNSNANTASAELAVGLKNGMGSVQSVLSDVLNVYEADASALSIDNGTLFYAANFSATATKKWNNMDTAEDKNCLSRNDSVNDALDITVRPTAISERGGALKITDVTAAQRYQFGKKNYIAVVDVAEIPAGGTAVFCITPFDLSSRYTITKPGRYVFLINELLPDNSQVTKSIQFMLRFTAAGDYKFNEFKVYEVDRGATAPVGSATTFSITSLTNNLTFANGSAATVSDYFMDDSTISRRIAVTSEGKYVIWGKVLGDAVYKDFSKAIIGTVGNYNYAIKPSVKGDMYFYNTLADLAAGTNMQSSIKGASYWALETYELPAGTNVYVGFSISDVYPASEVYEKALTAGSIPYAENTFTGLDAFWTSYIDQHDVRSFLK